MGGLSFFLGGAAFLFLLSGCAAEKEGIPADGFPHQEVNRIDLNGRRMDAWLEVPLVRQSRDYTCGTACACSLLRYAGYDFDVREDRMAAALGTTEANGTNCRNLFRCLNEVRRAEDGERVLTLEWRNGLTEAELCEFLKQGKPVICLIQAWGTSPEEYGKSEENGHYVIAMGCDKENFYFMDPSTCGNYTYIPKREFDRRWHDRDGKETYEHFGLIVTLTPDYNRNSAFELK